VQAAQHTDTVIELLLQDDEVGLTAWQQAVFSRNIQVSEKMWEWAEKNLTADELESKLLLSRDRNGWNAWHLAARRGTLDMLLK